MDDGIVQEVEAAIRRAFGASLPKTSVVTPRCCVALSGGADSMCLAWAMVRVFENNAWSLDDLHLVHVDHGLRGDSHDQALELADIVRRHLGKTLVVKRWEGPKPTTCLQERAREARYDLLWAYCAAEDVPYLLTGHHGDDSLETLLMRLERVDAPGPGPGGRTRIMRGFKGLGGIHPARATPFGYVLRPLLGFTKQRLQETLKHNGIPWLEDPSNATTVYERNRLRNAMGFRLDEDGLRALNKGLNLIRRGDAALDRMVDFVLRYHFHPKMIFDRNAGGESLGIAWAVLDHGKALMYDAGRLEDSGRSEIFCRILDALPRWFLGEGACESGGAPRRRYPPRGRSYEDAWSRFLEHKAFTWQGLYLIPHGEGWHIFRDPGACPTVRPPSPWVDGIHWDHRFVVVPDHEDYKTWRLGPLTQSGWQKVKDSAPWQGWLRQFYCHTTSAVEGEQVGGTPSTSLGDLGSMPGPALYTLPSLFDPRGNPVPVRLGGIRGHGVTTK